MFNLNIHTVVVLMCFGNFIALAVLMMYKRGSFYDLSYNSFMAGKLLQGIAWPLLSLRGEISNLISVYSGNSLLIAGFALEAFALTFLGRNGKNWKYIYSALALAGIAMLWLFADTPNLWVGFASLATLLLFIPAAAAMIITRGNSLLRLTIGIYYGVFSVFLVFRSWYGFFYRGEFTLMTPGFIQDLVFIQLFFVLFTGGTGFLLMLKERDDMLLVQSEEKYRTLVEKANEAIIIIQDMKLVFANKRMSEISGITGDKLILTPLDKIIYHEDIRLVLDNYAERLRDGSQIGDYDFRLSGAEGRVIWVTISASKITWGGCPAILALLTDITERKNMEKERERIIGDLQKALSEVKVLSGLLPICSNCKKIRDDRGYWNQIEVYIREHSEADFSHSLCPDCADKLYSELGRKIT